MANSLRNKIKHFCYKGELSESERDRLINALDDTYLKQQPCEDCISREETLKVMCDKCPMYNCVTRCSSYRHIEKMPSVTPKVESEEQ